MSTNDDNTPVGTLGIERWVQFSFIGGALVAFWFLDHVLQDVVELVTMKLNMPTPNATLITACAAVASIILMAGMYRNAKVHGFASEVAVELANTTWPTRKETWSNTVVVFIVSIISAAIIGVFDAAWSAVTDLIY